MGQGVVELEGNQNPPGRPVASSLLGHTIGRHLKGNRRRLEGNQRRLRETLVYQQKIAPQKSSWNWETSGPKSVDFFMGPAQQRYGPRPPPSNTHRAANAHFAGNGPNCPPEGQRAGGADQGTNPARRPAIRTALGALRGPGGAMGGGFGWSPGPRCPRDTGHSRSRTTI